MLSITVLYWIQQQRLNRLQRISDAAYTLMRRDRFHSAPRTSGPEFQRRQKRRLKWKWIHAFQNFGPNLKPKSGCSCDTQQKLIPWVDGLQSQHEAKSFSDSPSLGFANLQWPRFWLTGKYAWERRLIPILKPLLPCWSSMVQAEWAYMPNKRMIKALSPICILCTT